MLRLKSQVILQQRHCTFISRKYPYKQSSKTVGQMNINTFSVL